MSRDMVTGILDALFVTIGDDALCAECTLAAKVDHSDPLVETWRYLSDGWVTPPVCRDCTLAIPVYINGKAV